MDKKLSESPLIDGALLADDDVPISKDFDPNDGKAEQAADVLREILYHMDIETDVNIRSNGEEVVLDVDGPDAGRAIGKKGQSLDALQFLVNKIVNRFPKGRRHIVVDSGDYRERHDKRLVDFAERQAERAMEIGKVITLKPMPARDRRVIHLSLAKFEGVSTQSNGEGANRRIQIIPSKVSRRPRR